MRSCDGFEIQQHFGSEISGDMLVDERVIGGGITAINSMAAQYSWPSWESNDTRPIASIRSEGPELAEGNLAVMVANRRTCAAASAVGEQCDIGSGRKSMNLTMGGEQAKFDEMIAAAAGPKL